MIEHERIANDDLGLGDVPEPGADLRTIFEFALTYDGYREAGSHDTCARIANERRHSTLDELRTCLFFEQRRWRHFGTDPESEDLEYIRDIVRRIRASLEVREKGDGTPRVPPEVVRALGWYVYVYVDPRDSSIFYVGKGKETRLMAHLSEAAENRKVRTIQAIRDAGLEPRLEVLTHQLPDEETAFRVEAAVIDALGLGRLTNAVRGWRSVETGRMRLDELVAYYAAKSVEVTDPAVLIRINLLYHHGMTPEELYEATRGVWKVGPRRDRARYALAVFEGVVRAVYEIERWDPAGTALYKFRTLERVKGRWEFTGKAAPEPVWSRYVGSSVAAYFKKGLRNPVVYAGIPRGDVENP